MWNTFKYTVLSLFPEKSIFIWTLCFPIILATLFNVMFSGLDDSNTFEPIPTAIVEDAAYRDTPAFSELVTNLAAQGDDQVLVAHFVASHEEAEALLTQKTVAGILSVDEEHDPLLAVPPNFEFDTSRINQTILKNIVDNYVRSTATIETLMADNPAVLADPTLIESLYAPTSFTEEITVIANTASSAVRYFYALLGFSAIQAAAVALVGITRTQPNLSALGARRAVGATSRIRTFSATLLACWAISFVCLLVAFLYMRFPLGVNFGGQDLLCIAGLLIASLMATGLGAFIGALPRLGEGAKSGIITGLSCFLALFAGLYGMFSQELADDIARNVPLLQLLNPVKQVADLFYSLYFYDTLAPFFAVAVTLLIMAAVFFVLAGLFMRRQRYASI